MVHKKYIKKDGKVFGPYLYENFREKGITKTRYLGRVNDKKDIRKNVLIIIGIFVLLAAVFSGLTYLVYQTNLSFFKGELPNSGLVNVAVQIMASSTPEIIIDHEVFVCENKELGPNELGYFFNVTDENPSSPFVDMSPRIPFYFNFDNSAYPPVVKGKIWSGKIIKSDILTPPSYYNAIKKESYTIYPEFISAVGQGGSDSEWINITIIEINNAPNIEDLSPVKTLEIWDKGENSKYVHKINVEDIEVSSGKFPNSSLNFSYEFLRGTDFIKSNQKIFNNLTGLINITGSNNTLGNYSIKFCVYDKGLISYHSRFTDYCDSTAVWTGLSDCTILNLTITDINRAPVIVSYYPNKTNLNYLGTQEIYFNISAYDPDGGSLDYYWYIDNSLEKVGLDNFKYLFGCGVAGNFKVKIVVSDGLLNNSVEWNVSVGYKECPAGVSSGGGGGGGGGVACVEKWGCGEWNQCKNLEDEKSSGNINFKDYDLIRTRCNLFNYNSETCGIQFRECIDTKKCGTLKILPGLFTECYYTKNPNCKDGIKNCHDGSCEFLIDCGGPCDACPTCKDEIQNQKEAGIDCGGPCTAICEEVPLRTLILNSLISYLVIGISILLALLVFFQIKKYKQIKGFYSKKKNKEIINNSVATIFLIGFVFILVFVGNFFILNVTDSNKQIITEPGFLASYGLLNNLFGNIGMFLNAYPILIPPTGPTESIRGYEDTLLTYNFSNNFSDPEDILTFTLTYINNNSDIEYYSWINLSTDGILTINSTKDSESGNFNLSVRAYDTINQGPTIVYSFDISPVNDAPQFVGLENKTMNAGDLFQSEISVIDEESNIPFVLSTEFIGDTLNSFNINKISEGIWKMSFIPSESDVGNYLINFSVMDNSSLGNQTTSQIVNFTVKTSLWNTGIVTEYNLDEDSLFDSLNLSSLIKTEYLGNTDFSFNRSEEDEFPNFNISNNFVNFTADDEDVGFHSINIIAESGGLSSAKTFIFNVSNIEESIKIQDLQGNDIKNVQVDFSEGKIDCYENADVELSLFINDSDFLVPQKNYYDEVVNVSLTLDPPSPNLISFNFSGGIIQKLMIYSAKFTPREADIGEYNLTITAKNKAGYLDSKSFNFTIINRDYDNPKINSPNESQEFIFTEGNPEEIVFNVSHFVGDDLIYKIYINNSLRDIFNHSANGNNLTWIFTPDFTDETYEEKVDLTLFVINPFYSEFNATRTWNLTINHANAPIIKKDNIDDRVLSYKDTQLVDLKNHFYDVDFYDTHYNQTASFNLSSNSNQSRIAPLNVLSDWTFILSSTAYAEYSELVNITAYDLDEDGDILTNVTSNNFTINFTKPSVEPIPVPTPTSGSSETIPVSLKIITPGKISAFAGDKIEIPLQLINTGSKDFNDLTLGRFGFKDGKLNQEVKTSLDKTSFKSLAKGKSENLTLSVFFDTEKLGDYEILVNVSSKTPKYSDWAKIYINLQAINESSVKDLIIFTEEIIAGNPECIELTELLNEAEKAFAKGDYSSAKIKSQEIVNACKKSIESISIPKRNFKDYSLMIYVALGIIFALIFGMIYYYFKRKSFTNSEQQSFNKPKDIINKKEEL